jgi:hypothetical protein
VFNANYFHNAVQGQSNRTLMSVYGHRIDRCCCGPRIHRSCCGSRHRGSFVLTRVLLVSDPPHPSFLVRYIVQGLSNRPAWLHHEPVSTVAMRCP